MDTACEPTEAPCFVIDANLLTLPALRGALNSGGLMSWSMRGFISRSVPGLLGALFLLSAVLVYPLTPAPRGPDRPGERSRPRGTWPGVRVSSPSPA